MTCEEAISYIEAYTWSATRLGLERTRELLSALGDPQKELKFIHVAGSNGKGSTCAMLASILKAAGYRTGLYISPHIREFRERIQINGEYISETALAEITERVQKIADKMSDHPSQFELVTAIALEYFRREHCDIVVLEVGMGGALDSTNVIDAPEAAVITNIGLEHTEYLGDTLEEIARTKGGIIKSGCDCVCYDGPPEVTRLIQVVCAERSVPFHLADCAQIQPLEHNLDFQSFLWNGQVYSLPLLGQHQLRNAAVVLTVVDVLRNRGWNVPVSAVHEGLRGVKWPARFEVLSKDPLFILDGGHNPQCALALSETLRDYLPGRKATFLIGVLKDKDVDEIIKHLKPFARRFVCVTPNSPRAIEANVLADHLRGMGFKADAFQTVGEAIWDTISGGGPAAAFGSLYMAGTIREFFQTD